MLMCVFVSHASERALEKQPGSLGLGGRPGGAGGSGTGPLTSVAATGHQRQQIQILQQQNWLIPGFHF